MLATRRIWGTRTAACKSSGVLDTSFSRGLTSVCHKQPVSKQEATTRCFSQSTQQESIIPEKSDSTSNKENTPHPYKNLYPWKSRKELTDHLIDNIVYHNHGLVAINKPYGIGLRDAKLGVLQTKYPGKVTTCSYNFADNFQELKVRLNAPQLTILKTPQRYSSGVMIFALNDAAAELYKKSVRSMGGIQTYNYKLVTLQAPSKGNGEWTDRVAIANQAGIDTDVKQAVIKHKFSRQEVKRKIVRLVNVSGSVCAKGLHGTALLYLRTTTSARNFLNIYCCDILAPILGDHLYNFRMIRMMGILQKADPTRALPGSLPQEYPQNLSENLGVTPQENLIVPFHAHLQDLTLRNFSGMDTHIEAPPPSFFLYTCNKLGLIK